MCYILMLHTGYSVRTKRSSRVNLATYQLEQQLMLALRILQNLTSTYAAIKVFRYVMAVVYDLTSNSTEDGLFMILITGCPSSPLFFTGS
jgi:hypothetical protein